MKKVLLYSFALALVSMVSCSKDKQICIDCTHETGNTLEMCGLEEDMEAMEKEWVGIGGTCTKK